MNNTITPPEGSKLSQYLANEEMIGGPGEKAPDHGISHDDMWDGYMTWKQLDGAVPDFGKMVTAVQAAHKQGNDPVRDLGIVASALPLPVRQYDKLMDIVTKLGPVTKYRRTRRSK